jgi:hypothetical protein
VRMFPEYSPYPLGKREIKHVVTVGIGPIRHGHTHSMTGHHSPHPDQKPSQQACGKRKQAKTRRWKWMVQFDVSKKGVTEKKVR